MNTVIVIPTYNEKDNIGPLVEEILNIVPDVKILIVDDNSPDGTGLIANGISKKFPQVKVLHRIKKEGLGKAYIAGFKEALKMNTDYIIQMDADFSHDPKYIPFFLREVSNCDIVLGSRFLNKNCPDNVSMLSRLANKYVKKVLGLRVADSLGGFKCFRKKVLEEVVLDELISKGFIFQAELLYRAMRKGFSLKEIPIIFYSRKAGNSKKSLNIICEAFFKIFLFK